jgi:hypothetical protein
MVVNKSKEQMLTSQTDSAATQDLEELMRQRALEMYPERGMEDGQAEDDWYRAENEMRSVPAEPSGPPEISF